MATDTYDKLYNSWKTQSEILNQFNILVNSNTTIRNAVIEKYNQDNKGKANELPNNSIPATQIASAYVWSNGLQDDILKRCASQTITVLNQNTETSGIETNNKTENTEGDIISSPFDRRLDRLEESMSSDGLYVKKFTPYSTAYRETTTSGYIIGLDTLEENLKSYSKDEDKKSISSAVNAEYGRMKKDDFYQGVPSLQNAYALVRLYGSKGGALLVNQKNQRRWYEVDSALNQSFNFASTPTTSALIDWGNGDPHGRTPYQFTDFVFAKYWKKIENNRLITLRRYPAPILDNLKFPGMEKGTSYGAGGEIVTDDTGSSTESIPFTPMASAVTYFGGDTGNTLNNILKFTTGVLWEDIQAAIWEVQADSVPDNTAGIGKMFGSIAKFSELLGVSSDQNFNTEFIMNQGQLPPDPYKNGPYENRIMGPVNRIDSVKKRKPGLDFKMEGLNLVFEYVARPVGGINPKAVLLDILSNFLVIGSASAVFFGGAHRFMAAPAKYPFVGNITDWYKGKPIEWAKSSIKQFAGDNGMAKVGSSNLLESAKLFINNLLSGDFKDAFASIFTGASGNLIKNEVAKKTAGQVPYLQGMRAILTGEPVGEWHVTIGNPLNPIAMIGNLVCDGITVEFNEELGPDDFPTEMKINVSLKHGMARDKDAIESIFNRGMGRIYTLPDSFLGSADYQTTVDKYTQEKTQTGLVKGARWGILYQKGMDSYNISEKQLKGRDNVLGGAVSIWNRNAFTGGISENSNITESTNELIKSAYRATNWIAQKAHS